MLKTMKNHMSSHRGDANVSKMTLVAIVFVVGAILLVLTTSAFRGPINRWFDKVQASWFADENGMFEADNAFLGVERNANGTYKDVEYVYYRPDGSYSVLVGAERATNGSFGFNTFAHVSYDANGRVQYMEGMPGGTCAISQDGTSITIFGMEYVAQPPQ